MPDGFAFATAGADGKVQLWNAAESLSDSEGIFTGHEGDVWSVAISPDGRMAASAGRDGNVRLWDLIARKPETVLRGHRGDVNDVAFSPDGKVLASGGRDGTVRVWDLAKGSQIVALGNGEAAVLGIAFSPEGRFLAASVADRVIRIWDSIRIEPDLPPKPRLEPKPKVGSGGDRGADTKLELPGDAEGAIRGSFQGDRLPLGAAPGRTRLELEAEPGTIEDPGRWRCGRTACLLARWFVARGGLRRSGRSRMEPT